MAGPRTYYETIQAAVADVAIHGYDSEERIAYWAEEIRKAAERSMRTEAEIDAMVREAMASVFRRQVDQGGVLRLNPGVTPYTLERVKPALRQELSKRISASANLIKLNRPQAVDKTLQRFRGWATSVPEGGSDQVDRAQIKRDVFKPLSQLSFEERRVVIDQNHKLLNSINTTVAVDGGAIGADWVSHKYQAGYDGRPEHNARDGKFFLVRGSWADKAGYVKPLPGNGYTDDVEQPGEWVFCFPGDSKIPWADGVGKGYRRWYSGELATFVTKSGKSLSCTPNHPILTADGWIPAGELQPGDKIIEAAEYIFSASEPDDNNSVPSISQVVGALEEVGVLSSISGDAGQFHGDGAQGDIYVVSTTRKLTFWIKAALPERKKQLFFTMASLARAAISTFEALRVRGLGAGSRLMSLLGDFLAKPWSQLLHLQGIGLATGSQNALLLEGATDMSVAYANLLRDFPGRVAGGVKAQDGGELLRAGLKDLALQLSKINEALLSSSVDAAHGDVQDFCALIEGLPFRTQSVEVVNIKRESWSGHVFNLETSQGLYVANGIIVSNCRCRWQFRFSLRSIPPDCLTDKGRDALREARAKMRTMA